MRDLAKKIAIITPAFAMAGGGSGPASGANHEARALKLDVMESGDHVEVQLIANSRVSQQVQFDLQLIGNSNARSKGDTSIAAGQSQVLSRMKTNFSDSWCATVKVSEGIGLEYTLTAGDC